MEVILPYLQDYEAVIYVTLGFVAVYYLFKLVGQLQEWRGAVFGIEREVALRRFRSSLSVMLLLILFGSLEFVLVSFVAPSYPTAVLLSTPTLDLLATPTFTLEPQVAGVFIQGTQTPTPEVTETPVEEGCVPGKIEWVEPKPDQEISGTLQLKGTVNVPNLGFYKYEYSAFNAHPTESATPQGNVWTSIAASKEPKVNGEIGFWNTSQLDPGEYLLRLMVYDNQNKAFPVCVVRVKVVANP